MAVNASKEDVAMEDVVRAVATERDMVLIEHCHRRSPGFGGVVHHLEFDHS